MLYCPNGRVNTSMGELELTDKLNIMQGSLLGALIQYLSSFYTFLLYYFFCILSFHIWALLIP